MNKSGKLRNLNNTYDKSVVLFGAIFIIGMLLLSSVSFADKKNTSYKVINTCNSFRPCKVAKFECIKSKKRPQSYKAFF